MSMKRLLAALATAATASALLAAPAHAETAVVRDGADTSQSLHDVRRVAVEHGEEYAWVRVRFTDLQKTSDAGPASITLFLDTREARTGPEYALFSGLQEGTDYQLRRMRDWKPVGDPLTCEHDLTLRWGRDRLLFAAGRTCLGTPDQLRAGVKMLDLYDGSHPIVDWMSGRREFTPWVSASAD